MNFMNRRQFLSTTALPALLQAQAESGFAPLFDGQTLHGWKIKEGPESAFYVNDGAIVVHDSAGFPTWLSSETQYENFDFRGEFYIKGWMNSGIYIHAPEHGRNIWCGMKINIFQDHEDPPKPESMGSIFPLVPPLKINVKNKGEWNSFRILMDWPKLQVWTNDELIQDLNVESHPDLRHRLRRGYLGFESLSYANRFRNLRIRELPSKQTWQTLYESPADFEKWTVSEGEPHFQPLGGVLHGDGLGHIATRAQFRDFELQMYVRHVKHHNSGVLFRTTGKGLKSERHYEIQLHDVEGAHYPTGSLYHFKRSIYPRIQPEQWYLLQLSAKGPNCLVRINGENVLEYDRMDNLEAGPIELQAHDRGKWTQFKEIHIRAL
jgi:3-keto-disaccharide hydrolase